MIDHESLLTGIVYQDKETPSYESQIEQMNGEPLAKQDIKIDKEQFEDLTKQFI